MKNKIPNYIITKRKVGDKVLIININEWYKGDLIIKDRGSLYKRYEDIILKDFSYFEKLFFTWDMPKYCDSYANITKVVSEGVYKLDIDNGRYNWVDDMFHRNLMKGKGCILCKNESIADKAMLFFQNEGDYNASKVCFDKDYDGEYKDYIPLYLNGNNSLVDPCTMMYLEDYLKLYNIDYNEFIKE